MLLVDVLEAKRKNDKSDENKPWNSAFLEELYETNIGSKVQVKSKPAPEVKDTSTTNKSTVDTKDSTTNTDTTDVDDEDEDESLLDDSVDDLGVATEDYYVSLEDGDALTNRYLANSLNSAIGGAVKGVAKGAQYVGGKLVDGTAAAAKGLYSHYKNHEEFYDDKASKIAHGAGKLAVGTAKGVTSGTMRAIKSLIRGGFILSKFSEKKSVSINKLEKKLNRLLNQLDTLPDNKPLNKFDNSKVIVGLKIGNNKNLTQSVDVLTKLMSRLDDYLRSDYVGQTISISRDIERLKRNENSTSSYYLDDSIFIKGFKKNNTIDNTKQFTVSFIYEDVLPDDLNIVMSIPDPSLRDADEIKEAFANSNSALSSNEELSSKYSPLDYYSKNELKLFIEKLLSLLKMMRSTEKITGSVSKQRGGLVKSFKDYLAVKSGLTKDTDSLAILEAKSLFIDKVYVSTVLRIENETYNFVRGSLTFVAANIKELRATTK
jgi:hypothetical protein